MPLLSSWARERKQRVGRELEKYGLDWWCLVRLLCQCSPWLEVELLGLSSLRLLYLCSSLYAPWCLSWEGLGRVLCWGCLLAGLISGPPPGDENFVFC